MEEQLAKFAVASESEVRRVKEEMAGLKTKLDGERADKERLQKEVRDVSWPVLCRPSLAAVFLQFVQD